MSNPVREKDSDVLDSQDQVRIEMLVCYPISMPLLISPAGFCAAARMPKTSRKKRCYARTVSSMAFVGKMFAPGFCRL